jgi:hypothetical protein
LLAILALLAVACTAVISSAYSRYVPSGPPPEHPALIGADVPG